MRKTRLEILENEIDECYNMLECQKIEQRIAFATNDDAVLKEIGPMIVSIQKRIGILNKLLEEEKNPASKIPYSDFQCLIQIKKEF